MWNWACVFISEYADKEGLLVGAASNLGADELVEYLQYYKFDIDDADIPQDLDYAYAIEVMSTAMRTKCNMYYQPGGSRTPPYVWTLRTYGWPVRSVQASSVYRRQSWTRPEVPPREIRSSIALRPPSVMPRPLLLTTAACWVLFAVCWTLRARLRRMCRMERGVPGHVACGHCGYPVDDLVRCPECGASPVGRADVSSLLVVRTDTSARGHLNPVDTSRSDLPQG